MGGRSWVESEFAERLRTLILGRYPSILPFCLDAGFNPADVYRWLNGRSPTRESLWKLATVLNVTPAEILFGKDGGKRAADAWALAMMYRPKRQRRTVAKAIGALVLLGAFTAPASAQPLRVDGGNPERGIMSTSPNH